MMITEGAENKSQIFKSIWFRISIFLTFLIGVNIAAGYIAIAFRYPSLFNANPSFMEYALPLPFTWALAHLPSMFVYGIPLLLLPIWQEKSVKYFRVFCCISLLLYFLELDNKIPFILFFKIDAFSALLLSFLLRPLSRKESPKLVATFKIGLVIGLISVCVFIYSAFQHRTPTISQRQYADGVFELRSIVVNNDFRKNFEFKVILMTRMPEEDACNLAQNLAADLMHDYPFDDSYEKKITVSFNTAKQGDSPGVYEIGEISLNDEHKESDGRFACYLKYRK